MDFKYPYTDFHELNLDWFLAEFKKLTADWLQVQHDWEDEQQAFQDLHDFVQDYFANLNLYQEVHDVLYSTEMQQTIQLMLSNITTSLLPTVVANQIASVVASQLAPVVAAQLPNLLNSMVPSFLPAAVAGEAAAWLADHVDPDTGYVIDDTLTIQLAAADAKEVGDRIADFASYTEVSRTYNEITADNTAAWRAYYNSQYNRVGQLGGSNNACKIYHITNPGTYRIYGYGDDNNVSIMAILGGEDMIVTGNTGCNCTDRPTIPVTSYAYATVEITIPSAGYLYVNYSTAGNLPKVEEVIPTMKYVVDTDTLLNAVFKPANAKAVGDALNTLEQNINDALDNITQDHGIIKSGSDYTYFKRYEEGKYVLQKISRVGANNLYDYSKGSTGHLSNGSMIEDSVIWTYYTDQIGPVSLRLQGESTYGWTGGNHSKTSGGDTYPTAEHNSITVKCNGQTVTTDGIYFGDADIIVTDSLYAPNTINSADLSQATKVIEETKHFILHDSFRVQVKCKYVQNADVALYYGMQHQISHMDDIYLPTAGMDIVRTDLAGDKITSDKEWRIFMQSNDYEDNMILHHYALGEWEYNDGTQTIGRIASYLTSKIYYVLLNTKSFIAGQSTFWDGEYELKVK